MHTKNPRQFGATHIIPKQILSLLSICPLNTSPLRDAQVFMGSVAIILGSGLKQQMDGSDLLRFFDHQSKYFWVVDKLRSRTPIGTSLAPKECRKRTPSIDETWQARRYSSDLSP